MATKFEVKMSVENEERLNEVLRMDKDFIRRAQGLFLDITFQVHKYLIRVTPLDTGELRGGWTSILNKYSQDYSRQILDKSLYDDWKQSNKTPEGREYHFDPSMVLKGAGQSAFEDLPFDVTVINSVPQGEYMEYGAGGRQGLHTTEFARYKGELALNTAFEKWFEAIAQAESITDPGDIGQEEIPN